MCSCETLFQLSNTLNSQIFRTWQRKALLFKHLRQLDAERILLPIMPANSARAAHRTSNVSALLGCRHADNKIQPSSDPASAAWSCENPTTLGDLKHRLNFTGWVMSDW